MRKGGAGSSGGDLKSGSAPFSKSEVFASCRIFQTSRHLGNNGYRVGKHFSAGATGDVFIGVAAGEGAFPALPGGASRGVGPREVALKQIRSSGAAAQRHLQQEIGAVFHCRAKYAEEVEDPQSEGHPNIVAYLDWFSGPLGVDREVYLVMELCQLCLHDMVHIAGTMRQQYERQHSRLFGGGSPTSLGRRSPKSATTLDSKAVQADLALYRFTQLELVKVLKHMLAALSFMNRHGLAHRDVKCENILWARGAYKLADFGTAAFIEAPSPFSSARGAGRAVEAALHLQRSSSMPLEEAVSLPSSPSGATAKPKLLRAKSDSKVSAPHACEAQAAPNRRVEDCGTLWIMAPELLGRRLHGLNCDVWSLGVVLFEVAVLGKPFNSKELLAYRNSPEAVHAGSFWPFMTSGAAGVTSPSSNKSSPGSKGGKPFARGPRPGTPEGVRGRPSTPGGTPAVQVPSPPSLQPKAGLLSERRMRKTLPPLSSAALSEEVSAPVEEGDGPLSPSSPSSPQKDPLLAKQLSFLKKRCCYRWFYSEELRNLIWGDMLLEDAELRCSPIALSEGENVAAVVAAAEEEAGQDAAEELEAAGLSSQDLLRYITAEAFERARRAGANSCLS